MKLLKFTAPWCGQCRAMSKQFEKFDVCEIVSYDVDEEENEYMIDQYNIKNLPLLILVDENGVELKRWSGIVNIQTLTEEIKGFVC